MLEKLTLSAGATIYVNPEHVIAVTSSPQPSVAWVTTLGTASSGSSLVFTVQGSPADVAVILGMDRRKA